MLGSGPRTIPNKLTRCFLVIAVFWLLVGCAMRLAYNTLDFWIPYYLSDFVSLDSRQELIFDNKLQTALATHRREELPKLHRALDELQTELSKPLSYTQIRSYHFRFTALGQDTLELLAAPLAAMLSQLNDQQVAQLNYKIRSEIDDRRQERAALTIKEKVAKRNRALERMSLFWLGSLTLQQKQLLNEMAGYQIEMEHVFFEFWNDFLDNWRILMDQRSKPDFKASLIEVLQRLAALENAKLQSELNFYLNRRFDVIRRLENSLDSKQREHLSDKLADIRKNVAVLINN